MISFAAGLAREGFEPWLHTFAVFLYRRPLDQLQMSVAYPNLKVRLVGFLPGITTPGGVTHQAIDDVAVMRAIPNMTIVETGDATEVESVVDVAHAVDGPVYVRMLRGEVPRLFPADEPMQFNRARVLSLGGDALDAPAELVVLTSGILTEEALRAIPALRAAGVSVSHLHVSTLKPFTDPTIITALRSAIARVITMENHLTTGGLGSAGGGHGGELDRHSFAPHGPERHLRAWSVPAIPARRVPPRCPVAGASRRERARSTSQSLCFGSHRGTRRRNHSNAKVERCDRSCIRRPHRNRLPNHRREPPRSPTQSASSRPSSSP